MQAPEGQGCFDDRLSTSVAAGGGLPRTTMTSSAQVLIEWAWTSNRSPERSSVFARLSDGICLLDGAAAGWAAARKAQTTGRAIGPTQADLSAAGNSTPEQMAAVDGRNVGADRARQQSIADLFFPPAAADSAKR